MKISSGTIAWPLVFIWFIFMGVTAVSYGFGALYPSLNKIAQPFVCSNGQMSVEEYTSNPMPGTTVTQIYWYCADGKSGAKTKLADFPIHLYAGVLYGLLMSVVAFILSYYYDKQMVWAQNAVKIIVAAVIIFLILIPILPLFGLLMPESTSESTPAPDVTATSIALTFEALTSKTTSDFSSTEKPLSSWNNIPVMPQAIAGQQTSNTSYTFNVSVDSGSIESFYTEKLKSLGWSQTESRWQGMKFMKDKNVLLFTVIPASNMQSFVVTLTLLP